MNCIQFSENVSRILKKSKGEVFLRPKKKSPQEINEITKKFRKSEIALNLSKLKRKTKIKISNDSSEKKKKLINFEQKTIESLGKRVNFSKGSLKVDNFHLSITEKELRYLFGYFGYIASFYIKSQEYQAKRSNSVFIRYGIPECAIKAACFFEKKFFYGKLLNIKKIDSLVAIIQNSKESNFNFFKKLQYEQKKTSAPFLNSWTSLFRANIDIFKKFTEKYGEKKNLKEKINDKIYHKSQFLMSQGRIIAESRTLFKKEGILAEIFSFSKIRKKSRHCFFIKFKFFNEEFFNHNIFINFGKIISFYFMLEAKFIIIEYKNSDNAKSAFNYFNDKSKFEINALVDWIPLNFIKNNKNLNNYDFLSQQKLLNIQNNSIKIIKKSLILIKYKEEFKSKNKNSNLCNINFKHSNLKEENTYIGNLIIRNIPFKSTIINLKKIFSKIGKVLSIRLPKKKNGENKGFAFVVYQTLNDAKKALIFFQNTRIDSRNLKIALLY